MSQIKKSWYDKETDILYIQVQEGNLSDSREVTEDIRFDLDEKDQVLGIEIHHARTRVLQPISAEIASFLGKKLQSA